MWADGGFMFTTSLGTFLHPRNPTRAFKQLIKDVELKEIGLHDLRHTYALLALQRGTAVRLDDLLSVTAQPRAVN